MKDILRPSLPRWAGQMSGLQVPFADYARAHLRVTAVERAFDQGWQVAEAEPLRIQLAVAALPRLLRYREEAVAQRREALRQILLGLENPPNQGAAT